ncbi:MAG TPA: hypothetical protein VFQ07_09545 [Candidatus Polarisedimenticolia bacterium]|nr:hypothetical protein [Candidatus Polarisedimenticolia bacterium]
MDGHRAAGRRDAHRGDESGFCVMLRARRGSAPASAGERPMWCPNQECPDALETGTPAELRDEIAECPFCGSALVASLPEWAVPAEPVQASWVPILPIIQDSWVPILKSLLEPAGIKYVVSDESVLQRIGARPATFGFNQVTGAPVLLVGEADAEKAVDLLSDFREAVQGEVSAQGESAAQGSREDDVNDAARANARGRDDEASLDAEASPDEEGAPAASATESTARPASPTRCNACGQDLETGEGDEPLTYCYFCGASLAPA